MRIFLSACVAVLLLGLSAMAWLAFTGPERSWVPSTAEVSGFGGNYPKHGLVDVYLRNATGYGVIIGVPASQLDCRVGELVAAEQAGRVLRSTGRTCRDWSRTNPS